MESPLPQPAPTSPDSTDPAPPANTPRFPVVGIGASAGGLAALQRLFGGMQTGHGMAFVVILHLSPTHESTVAEILQRVTHLTVTQVREPVKIEPDHVYIIPPMHDLGMDDGHLRLVPLARTQGAVHASIDLFFRALADVHGEFGIGLVLSGTGSDGAVGITRIKEAGGVTLAQSPEDAEFDGMPRACIATGRVDIVLPLTAMPARLVDLWRNMKEVRLPLGEAPRSDSRSSSDAEAAQRAEAALVQVMALLRTHTHHDFRHYKRATVLRRIERRLQVNRLPDLPAYRDYIRHHPAESALLLQDLLISVTNFFRDREAFDALQREVLPALFRGRHSDEVVRVWVAGCATGEEAYSIAMLLREQAATTTGGPGFQVFATDIDERAIAVARAGLYPGAIATDVSATRLRQHFVKEGDSYRVAKAVREKVLFAAHNVLRDPPFSKLDLVCCRNLMIYLQRSAQTGILDMFRFALKPGGMLMLGISESVDAAGEAFTPTDKKHRIFRVSMTPMPYRSLPALSTPLMLPKGPPAAGLPLDRPALSNADIHRRSLDELLPPSVLVDGRVNILHLSAGAGRFMEHRGGVPSMNLLENVSAELRLELRTAVHSAAQSGQTVNVRNVRSERGGQSRQVHLSVRPFKSAEGADLALIVFDEAEPLAQPGEAPPIDEVARQLVSQVEQENYQLKALVQDTVERYETSTEELKASNEELQAINEELRSATEELETSKEELQSTNEELSTVNFELKTKVEETSRVNDDLHNLMAANDIATIIVDGALQIKRFTPRAVTVFNLIPADIGRSLLDITHKLDYPLLGDDATQAFAVLRPVERLVPGVDGRRFLARFLPYRTSEDVIVGAVLNFFDVTALHTAEAKVLSNEQSLRVAAEATRDFAIVTMDEAGLVTAWNAGAARMFQWHESEILGKPIATIFTPEDCAQGVPATELNTARTEGRAEDERWHLRRDGSVVYCSGVMTRLDEAGARGFAKIARDMTEQKRLAAAEERLRTQDLKVNAQVLAGSRLKDEFLAVMSHELKHPLNLIHVNAELMSRSSEARAHPAVQRASHAILRAASSQAKIIDDLLDLSHVSTGKLKLQMADLVLGDTVAAIVQAAQVDADRQGVALVFNLAHANAGLLVHGDRVRIEQIVWNLISNAIKFTPAGGRVSVAVEADPPASLARLSVQDTGRGIAAEFLPHIFEMFSQQGAGPGVNDRGLGICLALVHALAVAHGGEVTATSAGEDLGARFTLVLPLRGFDSGRAATAATEVAVNPLQGLRVLLVDDSTDALEAFAELLGMEGATVTIANTGQNALDQLARARFDLLISDLGMAPMSGYELVAAVRKAGHGQRLPAIALSGYGRTSDANKALQAGFDAHLTKPASLDEVQAVLRGLVVAGAR
ncbi:MAG: cheBR [Rhodoferax sp.]|nr:cheBR [Rhodoferax sp.]